MSDAATSFIFPRTGLQTRNRAVLAAMTNKQSNVDGTLSDEEIAWLLKRAEGGFGIVTTAASHVVAEGQGWDGEMGVWGDHQIPRLKTLADGIRQHGGLSLAQIFHGGMRSPQKITGVQPVSASQNPTDDSDTGFTRELTHEEIEGLIESFANAAQRCEDSGFDGLEIHGAHGYLICQFLGTETNRRDDQWGGDLENRASFLLRIIERIKQKVSNNFLVGVRISPEFNKIGVKMQDSLDLVELLLPLEIDFLHISCWDSFVPPRHFDSDGQTITEVFADKVKGRVPIISTGAIWSTNQANNVLEQGADLVGVGRVGIGHHDWASHLGDSEYNPQKPPFTSEWLAEQALSQSFIEYMRSWQGFVI